MLKNARMTFNPHFTRTLLETTSAVGQNALMFPFNPHFTRTLLETTRVSRKASVSITFNPHFTRTLLETSKNPHDIFNHRVLSILILRGRFLKRFTISVCRSRRRTFNPHFTRTLLETVRAGTPSKSVIVFQSSFYEDASWNSILIPLVAGWRALSILILRGRFLKLKKHICNTVENYIFQSSFYEDASWNWGGWVECCGVEVLSILILRGRFLKPCSSEVMPNV